MKCPYCSHPVTKVLDKRENTEKDLVRRRRACAKCGKRFTTYEEIGSLDIVVLKKDGSRQDFNREKLFHGIKTACEKRQVTEEQIIHIVDAIEMDLRKRKEKEIQSLDIGKKVLQHLMRLDTVAYMRFASVYYSFEDLKRFEEEIQSLKKGKQRKKS